MSTHWPRLVRSAVLLGCTPTEVEDVVQTALERCLVKWAAVERASDRESYVHRVLINTFASALRRRWSGERPTGLLRTDRPPTTPPGDDDYAMLRAQGDFPNLVTSGDAFAGGDMSVRTMLMTVDAKSRGHPRDRGHVTPASAGAVPLDVG